MNRRRATEREILGSTASQNITPTPLWASLLLTFSASAGSLVIQTGIYFLTTNMYKFTQVENYSLGVVQGLTYIAGAMGAGPLIRALRRAIPGLSTRAVLISMLSFIALMCVIPKVTLGDAGEAAPHWPIWLLVMLYSPTSGMLWPLIESYIAGGRSGQQLRSTIGWWNVVWSSSLIFSSVALAQFMTEGATDLFLALGGVHVGCALLLTRFGKEPLPHPHEAAHDVPASYSKLLVTFRWLLPMSYLVCSAMIPFLSTLMNRMNIDASMHPILSATWLLFRTIGFVAMERSKKWHGRWLHPALAMVLMLAGFALVALCVVVGGTDNGRYILIGGLACFGLGMAMIYAGAIYYAMEVGQAQVDAGGAHEGLIGVGYTVGPAIGLAAAFAVQGELLKSDNLEPAVLGGIAIVAVIVAGVVARRIHTLGGRS